MGPGVGGEERGLGVGGCVKQKRQVAPTLSSLPSPTRFVLNQPDCDYQGPDVSLLDGLTFRASYRGHKTNLSSGALSDPGAIICAFRGSVSDPQ